MQCGLCLFQCRTKLMTGRGLGLVHRCDEFSHGLDLHVAVLQLPLDGMDHPLLERGVGWSLSTNRKELPCPASSPLASISRSRFFRSTASMMLAGPWPRSGTPKAQSFTAVIAVAAPSPVPSIALDSTAVGAKTDTSTTSQIYSKTDGRDPPADDNGGTALSSPNALIHAVGSIACAIAWRTRISSSGLRVMLRNSAQVPPGRP